MENFDPKKELELGRICFKKDDQIGARAHWLSIPDKKDEFNTYGKAQFFLGVSYYQEGDIRRARAHWLKVPDKKDEFNTYGKAQFFLALSYDEEGDIKQARAHWLKVRKKEDEVNTYGNAQFCLGVSYYQEGDIKQARAYWLKVPNKKDAANTYDRAQFGLGYVYSEEGDIRRARVHLLNILKRENEVNIYDQAQFNLGAFYNEEGDIERARAHWLKVPERENEANTYGKAQLNLGLSYVQEGDIERARAHWLKVPERENEANTYGKAQLNLGLSYYQEGDIKQARAHWLKVPNKKDEINTYGKVKFYLGCSYYQEGNRKNTLKYWNKALKIQCSFQRGEYNASLEIYNIQKIINYFKDKESNKDNALSIYQYIRLIQEYTQKILKNLYINKYKDYEQNVAHYTRADIAKIIIRSGYFQLGVSNHMNDSLEGKILLDLFNISMCYNNDLLAFLTSFTFSENSLNQFRLYGKEDNKDGTGVSLVIHNNFFNPKFDPEDPSSFINISFKDNKINQSKANKGNITGKKEGTNKDIRLSEKLPLFRCIYIDPKNNYVSVASKSKASFYASAKNIKNIERSWKKYSKKINDLSKSLEDELKGIKGNIEAIKNLVKIGSENSEAIYEAIGTTLLPLIYLTKHVAFEEEAECRIIYITSLTNNLIKSSDTVRRLYVEYSTKITALDSDNKIYLEKIYLGPKADSKMELILKKDWIDSLNLKSDQHVDIPKIEKSTLPLA